MRGQQMADVIPIHWETEPYFGSDIAHSLVRRLMGVPEPSTGPPRPATRRSDPVHHYTYDAAGNMTHSVWYPDADE